MPEIGAVPKCCSMTTSTGATGAVEVLGARVSGRRAARSLMRRCGSCRTGCRGGSAESQERAAALATRSIKRDAKL